MNAATHTPKQFNAINNQASSLFFQPKLAINQSNDVYEQEADTVADRVMEKPYHSLKKNPFFKPSVLSVQRKCAHCEEEEKKIQPKESSNDEIHVPGQTENYIQSLSGGSRLNGEDKMFFESRMGYDFSDVRLHTDSNAARSAQSINALAYTNGNNIVFNEGQFAPGTDSGKRLLSHELTHVIQQSAQKIQPAIIQKQPGVHPTVTPRGPNPADCLNTLCDTYERRATPTNDAAAHTLTTDWLTAALACIHNNAVASNASHQQEIVQNEESELQHEVDELNNGDLLTERPIRASRFRDFKSALLEICRRKQKEIGIEFRYNVILDNSDLTWGLYPSSEWDQIEGAFSGLPSEATWMSPRVLTFKRHDIHPTQPSVAGETDLPTRTITIYNSGFGSAPYGRSTVIGIPATTQTIQHEVGHVVVDQIPRADYNDFFDNILHWHTYSWAWVTARSTISTWQAERNSLMHEVQMDDAHLDAWLTSLQKGTRVTIGNRSYVRGDFHLESFEARQVPASNVFEYAATNKDDYLSEIYTFCVSNPEYMYRALPRPQVDWLRRVVFKTPLTTAELSSMYAMAEPEQSAFLQRASHVFTWEQINAIFNQVMVTRGSPQSALA
jgi:hypothetical protein